MIPGDLLDEHLDAQLREQVQQQVQLRQPVRFSAEEWPQVLQQLWSGLPGQPPSDADPSGAWIVLLRMEHREPARLDDATRLQLLQELLQRDLNAAIEPMVTRLLSSEPVQDPQLNSDDAGMQTCPE